AIAVSAASRCGDGVIEARDGSLAVEDDTRYAKLNDTAFAWNFVAMIENNVFPIAIAWASLMSFAESITTAMPFAGAPLGAVLGCGLALESDGTASAEPIETRSASSTAMGRRMARDTTPRIADHHLALRHPADAQRVRDGVGGMIDPARS